MWGQFDTSISGGFDKNTSTQGGSATKKNEQVRRVQNVVPVFISHITECNEEDFTLHGNAVQMVDVLGVIRNFDVQSTKATCVIEDQSASIQAILWLETDGNTVSSLPPVQENCYARVFGSVRTQGGSKMIMILKIIPIDDINVLTYHRLQIIHAKLAMQKVAGAALTDMNEMPVSTNGNQTMSFGDISAAQDNAHGLKPLQAKVLAILKSVSDYKGVFIEDILAKFEPGQAREVRAALDFLLNEGHAYTTCDNDHYKATDGF